MLRPERMTSTSIICTKKNVESILETLNTFGEFHIEPSTQEETSLAEYNQNIQKVEERILDVDGLIKELVHEKGSLFGIFKTTQPVKVQVTADNWQALLETTSQEILTLKKEIEQLDGSLSSLKETDAQLIHLKKMLSNMECVGADLATIENLKLISVTFASIPFKNMEPFQTAISTLPHYMNQCHLIREEHFVCAVAPIKHKEEVERILRTYHAEIFHMPDGLPQNIRDAGKEVDNCLKENREKEKEVTSEIQKIGEKNKDKLASWKETSENILALLNAEKKIFQSGRLATVKGFVPQRKFKELTLTVNQQMEGKAVILQNQDAEVNDLPPPTKITHGRFVKPFEEITKLYGLPKYDEVDPTPLMAITFPILFGLMFGDFGHGLVLLVGGLTVGLLIKGNQSIKNVCWIIASCGIAAMAAGVVFGEFFGLEFNQIFGQGTYTPLFSPFLNPTINVFTFLIFALVVGIVQITSGIVLEMANFAVKRNYADALLTSAPKIAFYWGGIWLIATYQLNFGAWATGPILAPLIPFIIMVAGKPLYLMTKKPAVKHSGEHAEQDTFVGRLFEGGDFFTRLLSNTISYSRILALLMAHWALLLATYAVADIVNPSTAPTALGVILAGVIIIFGNIAVMALEGLIVFIHTLRLHFYEWFSKFYAGTGVEFSPFKQKFTHTILNLRKKQE